jgi:hypothetical protein
VGDGEPHSPELADELAVGRVKAGAELLRGGGGEPVRQGGLELGDAPRDGLVRRLDSDPRRRRERILAVWISTSARFTVDMTRDTLPSRQAV